jgi:hypothetical protein
MNELEKADTVLEALKAAEQELPQAALPILNGISGLIKGDGDDRLEIQEARTDAFMAICELGKALHRGQPVDALWAPAFSATERWRQLI